jgi:hypothetical protein
MVPGMALRNGRQTGAKVRLLRRGLLDLPEAEAPRRSSGSRKALRFPATGKAAFIASNGRAFAPGERRKCLPPIPYADRSAMQAEIHP